MKNNVLLGAFLCFIAAVSWGAMFPVADAAFEYIDPFYFTIFRYVSVTIILVPMLLWREGKSAFKLEGRGVALLFFGVMGFVIYNLLIFWGEDLLGEPGIMVASIMESVMPMISIVIVWIMFRNRPHFFTLSCVIIAFIGAALVITKGDIAAFFSAATDIIPSSLIFIAVVGWVAYTMGGKEFPGWSALRYSTLTCLLGTSIAVIVVLIVTATGYISFPTIETIKITSPHIAFMIIFPGVIALLGWNFGVSILSPLNGLLFLNFVPVTTLAISIVRGNTVTMHDVWGTVFIIAALLANNLFLRRQQRLESGKAKKQIEGKLQENMS